jgi:hypothetical protein
MGTHFMVKKLVYHAPGIGNWVDVPDEPIQTCIHQGEPTGESVDCAVCPKAANRTAAVHACAIRGKCAPSLDVHHEVTGCGKCKDKQFKPMMQVRCISAGIGDNLMALAVQHGIRQQFPSTDVIMVPSAGTRSWIELFDCVISHELLKCPTVFCEHDGNTISFKEFRQQRLARWEYWQREFGTTIAFPTLKALPESAIKKAIPYGGRVLLVPYASHADRTWPTSQWIEVERRLLANGFRCLILHSGNVGLEGFQSPKITARPPAEVAALMQVAICVAGNDSGMAHLAGMLHRPVVGICSHASDDNILGLYGSVTQLGSRVKGSAIISPQDVYNAIVERVRATFTGFPYQEFGTMILDRDRDRWRVPCWEHVYSQLWNTVKAINPKTIVEIGTRAGYSAWTMLNACPEASLIGIDADFDNNGGFKGACDHARQINPDRFELRIADSKSLQEVPFADMAYVDGDHSFEGCLSDLQLVERSGIKRILVDDTQFEDVRRAISHFAANAWNVRYIPSDTGLADLSR